MTGKSKSRGQTNRQTIRQYKNKPETTNQRKRDRNFTKQKSFQVSYCKAIMSIKKCTTTLHGKDGASVNYLLCNKRIMENSPYKFSDNPNSIGNLENILSEIERSASSGDIGLVSGWIESLRDRITLEGTRRYTDYSIEEKKVLAVMNILINYAEVGEELLPSK